MSRVSVRGEPADTAAGGAGLEVILEEASSCPEKSEQQHADSRVAVRSIGNQFESPASFLPTQRPQQHVYLTTPSLDPRAGQFHPNWWRDGVVVLVGELRDEMRRGPLTLPGLYAPLRRLCVDDLGLMAVTRPSADPRGRRAARAAVPRERVCETGEQESDVRPLPFFFPIFFPIPTLCVFGFRLDEASALLGKRRQTPCPGARYGIWTCESCAGDASRRRAGERAPVPGGGVCGRDVERIGGAAGRIVYPFWIGDRESIPPAWMVDSGSRADAGMNDRGGGLDSVVERIPEALDVVAVGGAVVQIRLPTPVLLARMGMKGERGSGGPDAERLCVVGRLDDIPGPGRSAELSAAVQCAHAGEWSRRHLGAVGRGGDGRMWMWTLFTAPRVRIDVPPCISGNTLLAVFSSSSSTAPSTAFVSPQGLPVQETETHPVLPHREIEMLHSGKPWVADWKHWNYTAAIKATETWRVRGKEWGVSKARRDVVMWIGVVEQRRRRSHAPIHLERAWVRRIERWEPRETVRRREDVHLKLALLLVRVFCGAFARSVYRRGLQISRTWMGLWCWATRITCTGRVERAPKARP
ncbi:hypothetical protein B0H13DRAFT_1897871 [Mycena leptocephala]|nr:hypothetical protein B0H13DRAFT_1897871 [Mycena leptocephala]